jgi:hypothetical protein
VVCERSAGPVEHDDGASVRQSTRTAAWAWSSSDTCGLPVHTTACHPPICGGTHLLSRHPAGHPRSPSVCASCTPAPRHGITLCAVKRARAVGVQHRTCARNGRGGERMFCEQPTPPPPSPATWSSSPSSEMRVAAAAAPRPCSMPPCRQAAWKPSGAAPPSVHAHESTLGTRKSVGVRRSGHLSYQLAVSCARTPPRLSAVS